MYFKAVSWLFVTLSCASFAAGDYAERDKVYNFIATNLIGKSVGHQHKGTSKNAKLAWDFKRKISYTNLHKTSEGLIFDEVIEIKQSNQAIDESGNPVAGSAPVVEDRTLVIRVSAKQSQSTGKMLGVAQVISNSNPRHDNTGTADFVSVLRLDGDTLILHRQNGLYADHFAAGGKTNAGRSSQESKIRVENGKLVADTKVISFLVDPETLKPTTDPEESTMHEVE